MCGFLASPTRVDRRLERLSGEYLPSVPRKSEANRRSGTSLLASLAATAHWYCDQANKKETGHRDHPAHGSWSAIASRAVVAAFGRRDSPQHSFHRALEWDLSRTARQPDAQI